MATCRPVRVVRFGPWAAAVPSGRRLVDCLRREDRFGELPATLRRRRPPFVFGEASSLPGAGVNCVRARKLAGREAGASAASTEAGPIFHATLREGSTCSISPMVRRTRKATCVS